MTQIATKELETSSSAQYTSPRAPNRFVLRSHFAGEPILRFVVQMSNRRMAAPDGVRISHSAQKARFASLRASRGSQSMSSNVNFNNQDSTRQSNSLLLRRALLMIARFSRIKSAEFDSQRNYDERGASSLCSRTLRPPPPPEAIVLTRSRTRECRTPQKLPAALQKSISSEATKKFHPLLNPTHSTPDSPPLRSA